MAVISPFALGVTTAADKWSAAITGLVIGVVALVNLATSPSETSPTNWPIVSVLAGIWLVVSTAFASGNTGLMWSDIVLGVSAITTALVALGYERTQAAATSVRRRLPAAPTTPSSTIVARAARSSMSQR